MYTVRIIFFSPTNTSAKIAYAIAERIGAEPVVSDITSDMPGGRTEVKEDITIVAAPVYGGRIPVAALERIQTFYSNGSYVVPVVVYGNRHYDDALLELTNTLTGNGFRPIAAGTFIGEHSYSRENYPVAFKRPDTEDIERANVFGQEIRQMVEFCLPEMLTGTLNVPGNYPYKEYKPSQGAPATDDDLCTQCEFCLEACPVQAISIPDCEMFSDPAVCIHCCACVKFCPEQARTFETPFSKFLFENFSARRQPEVWMITK